mgnify:FL=1
MMTPSRCHAQQMWIEKLCLVHKHQMCCSLSSDDVAYQADLPAVQQSTMQRWRKLVSHCMTGCAHVLTCPWWLQCILSSKLQDALESNADQLTVLQQQLKKLEEALWKGYDLVEKWSKPMGIGVVVCFVKANLDKKEIEDVSSAPVFVLCDGPDNSKPLYSISQEASSIIYGTYGTARPMELPFLASTS